MASIAALCKRKGWVFLYITNGLSSTLRDNIAGNLKAALDDGMQLLELSHSEYRDVIASLYGPAPDTRVQWGEGDLLLAQGGADLGSKEGIVRLAGEIEEWRREQKIDKLTVATPSGTGTTAYFLAASLPELDILTTPLIGTETYLREQMAHLGALPKNLRFLETEKRYRFATPYREYLDVYKELLKEGVEFDLLYAPKMFVALSAVLEEIEGEILYIHSGGVRGNSSMIERYRHKGML